MERRNFVKAALVGAVGASLVSRQANAADAPNLENVIFTDSQPGHWKGKEMTHMPIVEFQGDKMVVTTPHPMSEPHFIVSHTVVLQGGKFLGRKTFTWKDQPISEHTLPAGYKGKVTVTSTCNLHDWWMKEISV